MDFIKYQLLDNLIRTQQTGPVETLAKKLDVSPRKVKYMISKLKDQCNSPIRFEHYKQSYIYTEEGSCNFTFQKSNRESIIDFFLTNIDNYFKIIVPFLMIQFFSDADSLALSFFCPGIF